MNVRGWYVLFGMGLLIVLAGCSRAEPSLIGRVADQPAPGGSAPAAGPTVVEVAADANGALAYQQQALNGPADAEFTVNFSNPAAVEHNWVLAEQGQEQAIADAAQAAAGNPAGIAGVIAGHAPIAGSSEEVVVPPIAAGEYPYLCTVPGHFAAGMRGVLTLGAAPPPGGEQGEGAEPGASAPAEPNGEGGAPAGAPAVSSDPSGALRYIETQLEAAAGQPFSVQFDNPSPLQHNWVLVESGQEEAVAAVGATTNGDVQGAAGVIVAGNVLNGGQSEPVDVPAVEAGEYSYICTVPGHYAAGMRGTLNVR